MIASCLLSPLSKNTSLEHTSHFKLVRDPHSNQVNDLSKNKTMPVNVYDKLLIIRDKNKKFELEGYVLKMITTEN